jgi:hypothetical protein
MSISAISSSNVSAVYTQPAQQQLQAKSAPKAPGADTVTISKQAQLLASDGDTQAQEAKESGAELASKKLRGKA